MLNTFKYLQNRVLQNRVRSVNNEMSQLQTCSFRLPEMAIEELKDIANALYLPTWTMNRTAAVDAKSLGGQASTTDPQPTHEGVIVNGTES